MEGDPAEGDLEVTIRRARDAAAGVMSSWRSMAELRRYQPLLPLPPGELRRRLRKEGGASLDLESGYRLTWILEANGSAAGWVSLFNIDWLSRSGTLGFTVAPWAQRKGVGRRG